MSFRILVTGSRSWSDFALLRDVLVRVAAVAPAPVVIVHGAAMGADAMAGAVARRWGLTEEAHPADWQRLGKRAGSIRNQAMVNLGADVCVAFPTASSIGTWDCVRRAEAAGIPVALHGTRP